MKAVDYPQRFYFHFRSLAEDTECKGTLLELVI